MTQINGTWKPKFLRSFSLKSSKPVVDQARRKQLISESLWPTTLDREGYKAAAILRSFCRDGAYHDESQITTSKASQKSDVKREIKKIPAEIINRAKGLVIFNILRAGLWEDGAGGSGVIVARLSDGSWSTPAAIKLSTPEVGVVLGVDIFDCVLVLNTQSSVDALKKAFCVVGSDLYSVTGPLDVGWFLEADDHARNAPIFSYFRSQQYYADVQAENFAFNARDEENQSFYSPQMLSLPDILAGKARSPPATINGLMECLKLVQGDTDVNEAIITKQAPPSDFTMVEEGQAFAIPDVEDPDQYGYAALEKYGIVVVDAATKSPVAAEEFEFNPSIKSPAFEKYHRKGDVSSIDGRSSWRQSTLGSLNRHDAASTRSRNSIIGSSAPTSPPPISPTVVGQIQLEDNENEPNLNLTNQSKCYSSGKDADLGGSAENKRPDTVAPHEISTADLVSSFIVNDQVTASEKSNAETGALSGTTDSSSHFQRATETDTLRKSGILGGTAEQANLGGVRTEAPELSSPERSISPVSQQSTPKTDAKLDTEHEDEDDSSDNFEDLDEDFEIHDASASQPAAVNQGGATAVSLSQAKVVTVPKAVAPSLPVRNPVRLTMLSPPSSQITLDGQTEALDAEATETETSHAQSVARSQPADADVVEEMSERQSRDSFQNEKAFTVSSRSKSPTKTEKHVSAGPTVSLANMRQGLGSGSPEQSPER